MVPVPDPPIPYEDPSGVPADTARLIDPKTGQPVPTADMREEFARISRSVPRDPQAERAFIENKIEIIRNDPNLSAEEKEKAIAELRKRL
jgi:hypothetical protein